MDVQKRMVEAYVIAESTCREAVISRKYAGPGKETQRAELRQAASDFRDLARSVASQPRAPWLEEVLLPEVL